MKQNLTKLFKQFETELSNYDLGNRQPYGTKDFEASRFKKLHLRLPSLRRFKFSGFTRKTSNEEKLAVLDYLWSYSKINEALTWILIETAKFPDTMLLQNYQVLLNWQEKIGNWWHSDGLSGIYARILEEELEQQKGRYENSLFLSVLQRWNEDNNSWKRRQSVVSLLLYAQLRKRKVLPYEVMIEQVKNLLDDENYYVQKGVGWTIRELFRIYPEEIKQFLQENITQIKSEAWQAASERLDREFKEELKKKRNG